MSYDKYFERTPDSSLSNQDFSILVNGRTLYRFKSGQQRNICNAIDPYTTSTAIGPCDVIACSKSMFACNRPVHYYIDPDDMMAIEEKLAAICVSKQDIPAGAETANLVFDGYEFKYHELVKPFVQEVLEDNSLPQFIGQPSFKFNGQEYTTDALKDYTFGGEIYPVFQRWTAVVSEQLEDLVRK